MAPKVYELVVGISLTAGSLSILSRLPRWFGQILSRRKNEQSSRSQIWEKW